MTFGFLGGENAFHFCGPTLRQYQAMRQDALSPA